MNLKTIVIALAMANPLSLAATAQAATVGINQPAEAVTAERIAALPAPQQAAWLAYLARSQAQEKADRAALAAELPAGQAPPPLPEKSHANDMPLGRSAAWYGSAEARHVADVIVSFQTPGGGWSKNMRRDGAPRLPGQSYTGNNLSAYLGENDFDAPRDRGWNYVSTLDNDATITEMRFLARVAAQVPGKDGDAYRQSFIRGVNFVLAAQYPNGGWPQVWPLEGGYHDAITFNDGAAVHAVQLLADVASGKGDFAFVPAELRARFADAQTRALANILATQVVVDGKRTVWGQQHDPLTLKPVAGRNFEPPALASAESAGVLMYLMSLPNPSKEVVEAVHAGIAWLKAAAIHNRAWVAGETRAEGRHVVETGKDSPIWARYYTAATMKPVFGDRDKTLHDKVDELSLERRNGYAWYNTGAQRALEMYAEWARAHSL